MSKIEIKNRWTDSILFEYEKENNTLKGTVEQAVKEGAYLRGAYLEGAYLEGADLEGADLGGAYLGGADLEGADLEGADLGGAYLEEANLEGANLEGANLEGAYLRGADLEGADLEGADLKGAYICLYDDEINTSDIVKEFEKNNNIKITEYYINRNVIPTKWNYFWKYGLIICDWKIKEKEETTEESKETEEIKEIEYYEINGEEEQSNQYRLTESDNYICEYYNQFEMVVLRKINEIARRVNETERKVNKLIKEREEK